MSMLQFQPVFRIYRASLDPDILCFRLWTFLIMTGPSDVPGVLFGTSAKPPTFLFSILGRFVSMTLAL